MDTADLAQILDVLCDFVQDAQQVMGPWPDETLRPIRELADVLRRADGLVDVGRALGALPFVTPAAQRQCCRVLAARLDYILAGPEYTLFFRPPDRVELRDAAERSRRVREDLEIERRAEEAAAALIRPATITGEESGRSVTLLVAGPIEFRRAPTPEQAAEIQRLVAAIATDEFRLSGETDDRHHPRAVFLCRGCGHACIRIFPRPDSNRCNECGRDMGPLSAAEYYDAGTPPDPARADDLLCPHCRAKNRTPPAPLCRWCLGDRAREHDRLMRGLREAVSAAPPGDTGYAAMVANARLWVAEDLRDGVLTEAAAAARLKMLAELEGRTDGRA